MSTPSEQPVALAGIDCATVQGKTGVALALLGKDTCRVTALDTGTGLSAGDIARHLCSAPRALIALDAPLGWPVLLGQLLPTHLAGRALPGDSNRLFRRQTDRYIHEHTGKMPLDVGADRIARTAKAALDLLEQLRFLTDSTIPLAWEPDLIPGIQAIEVYPGGTLTMLGLPATGYKKDAERDAREIILGGLRPHLDPGPFAASALADADQLDALICLLAARDFIQDRCPAPDVPNRARREGWIWVRRKKTQTT